MKEHDKAIKEAKNFDWKTKIELGTWLDVKDKKDCWCLASVCGYDNGANKITVLYDGWIPKYKEVLFEIILF